MNDRQKNLIQMLENHLAYKTSIDEVDAWLTEHIKPQIFLSKAYKRPGMWLEMYAYREIHWHIADLQEAGQAQAKTLSWYWEEVRRILDLLIGNQKFKRTEYLPETFTNNIEPDIQQLLPYLQYAEKVETFLKLKNEMLDWPTPNSNFELGSIFSSTSSEFLMAEIFNTINEYKKTYEELKYHVSDDYYSPDLNSFQLTQLKKLIRCFRGEARYSISVTFEGFDKITVTIIV